MPSGWVPSPATAPSISWSFRACTQGPSTCPWRIKLSPIALKGDCVCRQFPLTPLRGTRHRARSPRPSRLQALQAERSATHHQCRVIDHSASYRSRLKRRRALSSTAARWQCRAPAAGRPEGASASPGTRIAAVWSLCGHIRRDLTARARGRPGGQAAGRPRPGAASRRPPPRWTALRATVRLSHRTGAARAVTR